MKNIFNKLLILTVLFFSNVVNFYAQETEILQKFKSFSGFKEAAIGIYAIDINTNEVIYNYQSDKLLSPASTTKLFSTAFALEELGPNYSPKTAIYYNGSITDSVLKGDLWIIGGGDMSLGSRYFEQQKRDTFLYYWAKAVKSSGIHKIEGNVYVDASKFGYEGTPDGWLWEDIGNYYGAHYTGAMIYDNILEYHFKTSASGNRTKLIATVPQLDALTFKNNVIASSRGGDHSYIYGSAYSYDREGRGTLPQNVADFTVKGSLPDPEFTLGQEFKRVLSECNIVVSGTASSTRVTPIEQPQSTWVKVLDYQGKSIAEIIKATNFESINVFAEGLMRLPLYEQNKIATTGLSSEFMQEYWKKRLNAAFLFLNDGSGLSRSNAITAKTMSDLLVYMSHSKYSKEYYQSLPVAGESGTLKNVAKNQDAQGLIHAKSGTMKRVKSYAGYAESKSGRRIAFAFILNNYSCSNAHATNQMELLMNELVNLELK
ncbi:MAG: D-alanyl-D-alanine carboxypeptidase/D-alanyl-D-alanine-endopeptidase [Crocinitomicaceae bacterium]|nr:D-alanyl-D-alanine carboxypeptidase/D-alanyl-D-alanine-endopeptidase [Crocinitomicaceae bacterium]